MKKSPMFNVGFKGIAHFVLQLRRYIFGVGFRAYRLLYVVAVEVTENCFLASSFLTLFIHLITDAVGVESDPPNLEVVVSLILCNCPSWNRHLFSV